MSDREGDAPPARQPDGEIPIASARCEMGDLVLFAARLSFRGSAVQERLGNEQPDREIALRRVTSVEWRKPSFFHMGRLGLVLEAPPGGSPTTVNFAFQTWERGAFEAFRDAVERGVAEARARADESPAEDAGTGLTSVGEATAAAEATATSTVDIPDQIRRLAELRDDGLITAEEFDAKKRELLARM